MSDKLKYPQGVFDAKENLLKELPDRQRELSEKLIPDAPTVALVEMWQGLEKQEHPEGEMSWVSSFLLAVWRGWSFDPFFDLKTRKAERELKKIESYAYKLINNLVELGLDEQIPLSTNPDFHRLPFDDETEALIKRAFGRHSPAVSVYCTTIIEAVVFQARDRVESERPPRLKVDPAIRFAQFLKKRNRDFYGVPLTHIVKTAMNTIYGTDYSSENVRKF